MIEHIVFYEKPHKIVETQVIITKKISDEKL